MTETEEIIRSIRNRHPDWTSRQIADYIVKAFPYFGHWHKYVQRDVEKVMVGDKKVANK
jgi:hypothetical protein